jgi:leucyl-tRNA synthetase
MQITGHLPESAIEPFEALFTQGMVCHETYRLDGKWLSPDEIETRGGTVVETATGRPVEVGPSIKMSKSKKNVVDPETLIATHGADVARWFMLSDSPPERDVEWTASGVEGAARHIQRVWRLLDDALPTLPRAGTPIPPMEGEALSMRRAIHKTIAGVTRDIEGLAFNKAIARLYGLTNTLAKAEPALPGMDAVLREGFEALALLCAPMTPHFAEALWEKLGNDGMVVSTPWPEADPDLARDAVMRLAIQINGKKRSEIEVDPEADAKTVEALALADPAVLRALGDGAPRRVIVVPGRIVNLVV